MQIVRFLKNFEMYNPQETAGFSEEITADLVRRGIAEVVAPGESVAALPSNPTPDENLGDAATFKLGKRRK